MKRLRLILAWMCVAVCGFRPPAFGAAPVVTLKAGASLSTMRGNTAFVDPGWLFGPRGTVAVEWSLAPQFGVAPELGYATRGFLWGESQGTDAVGNSTGRFKSFETTRDLTLAVPFRWAALSGGRIHAGLLGGPDLSLEHHETFDNRGAQKSSDSNDVFSGQDIGLLLGLWADVRSGPRRLGLEARYIHGLLQMWNRPGLVEYHSSVVEILATLRFAR